MIQALRRRHLRWSMTLGTVLPALYLLLALGGESRSPAGPVADADSLDRQPVGAPLVVLAEPPLAAEWLAAPGQAPTAIRIVPGEDPAIPDLLAYWAPTPGDGSSLPPDAVLLGALRGSRTQILPMPEPDLTRGGYLVLYSLGWNQVIATAAVPARP